MSCRFSIITAIYALGLWVPVGLCFGQTNPDLQETLLLLQKQNRVLEQGITAANQSEKEASEKLAEVRNRLEALGRNLLDGGDERLIQATADIQILNQRVQELEAAASQMIASVDGFLRQAVASDPDSRLFVESSMRELDQVLGLRQKPRPATQNQGTANRAKVMSIDSESGLLVLNVGEQQGARIGTNYRLYRGDQPYGTAVIADIRQSIAGAFVENLEPSQGPVRLGDSAILELE